MILLRHGQSAWNRENRFTGWTDVPLTAQGRQEAVTAGELLMEGGFKFRRAFTSYLRRAIDTLNFVLEETGREWIPVDKSWRLNEKHYGILQGWNKAETVKKYGEEQVHIWRRSYDVAPPALSADDPRNPRFESKYDGIPTEDLPLTESLADTLRRLLPYWEGVILPALAEEGEVIVAAHGNSLRGIVKNIKGMSNDEVLDFNIPTGVPYVFEFDDSMHYLRDYFLGDQEELKRKMVATAKV